MNDESGESTEPMEEVPLGKISDWLTERSRETRDEWKHTGRNDLLLHTKNLNSTSDEVWPDDLVVALDVVA